MSNSNNRSKNRFLVNIKFQLKYVLLVALFSSIVFGGFSYKFYQSEIGKQKLLQIQNPEVMQMVQGHDREILYYLAGLFVLQIASILYLGVMLTHRIAGPIFRVQRDLEKAIETNQIPTIRPVRKKDEFKGFFDALQLFIEKFAKK